MPKRGASGRMNERKKERKEKKRKEKKRKKTKRGRQEIIARCQLPVGLHLL